MHKIKRLSLFAAALVVAVGSFLTSCDDDLYEARNLSGQWTGNFGMFYEYEYRGQIYTQAATLTDIVFYPEYENATRGYGYQVDHYSYGPNSRLSFRFDWRVSDGRIILDYVGAPQYNAIIRDYTLNRDSFYGYYDDGTPFDLHKLNDFYWDDYSPYNYHEWQNPSWSYYTYDATRAAGEDEKATPSDSVRVVRVGHVTK